jgi:ATP-dependent DNA helicase RecG
MASVKLRFALFRSGNSGTGRTIRVRVSAPASQPAIRLSAGIETVPGVGSRSREIFARLGIATVGDLLKHLPLRYERHHDETTVDGAGDLVGGPKARSDGVLTLRGEIETVRHKPGPRPRTEATFADSTGRVRLVWFNAPWIRDKIHPGLPGLIEGKAQRREGYLEMVNPKWTPLERVEIEADEGPVEGRLRPVYPASEELSSGRIEKAIAAVLDAACAAVPDPLPEPFRRERSLLPLGEAYRAMHRPEAEDSLGPARRRLAYDELYLLQLGVMMRRHHLQRTRSAPAIPATAAIDRHIRERLPFPLTPDQSEVCGEIARDLARPNPMNRLLQGDVGSGKTAVAVYAMLACVAARRQACLMAPTELLAEQHFRSITGLLEGAPVRVALLTGSLPARERNAIVAGLADGSVDLAVGTHALLSEGVRFGSLALAVIDEQHRFGVAQRAAIRSLGTGDGPLQEAPHVLVMTATPIPRTLSLTIFGDLDVSTIRKPPAGRKRTLTRLVPPEAEREVWAFLADRIAKGEQAYVVVPAIGGERGEEGAAGDGSLSDVAGRVESLANGPLAGRRVAAVHGRMPAADREEVMDRFRRGEIDCLVATTVIEVGVDVPNASVIVVEHADRFGLAQLHQLRGRVGRGTRQGLCILIGSPVTDEGRARLEALRDSTDGFRIAELDLEIRGPGELFGARQSGLAPFRVADLPRDMELLSLARRDAEATIDADPTLAAPEHERLRKKLLHLYGDALGLADVA